MPETILKAPNYFDREIDLTERVTPVGGVPATIIGGAEKGPAFVPISLGSYTDFANKFGDVNPKFVGGYGVQKFLEAKGTELASCNYIRLLGCGANSSSVDISATEVSGTVTNAGMQVIGNGTTFGVSGAYQGRVQFLVAQHTLQTNEIYGMPDFSYNDSFPQASTLDKANLVRAVLFTAPDSRFIVLSGSTDSNGTFDTTAYAVGNKNYESTTVPTDGVMANQFKLALSCSTSGFSIDDGIQGLKVFTASLDPSSNQYISKILNTNPENFAEKKHLLYLHYPVDSEIAALKADNVIATVAVISGSSNNNSLQVPYGKAFGFFNTRYTSPKTPYFISQPFGKLEYDLFFAESLDDGAYANDKYKISITNLAASTNPNEEYGTFSLQVRAFNDTDFEPQILEVFNNLSLNPESDNYITKVIGDKKTSFNFDAIDPEDRKIVVQGKYGNRSKFIRVVASSQLDSGEIPTKALPFGFRGHQVLATNPALTDQTGSVGLSLARMSAVSCSFNGGGVDLSGSIVPPVPFRFTVTRNPLATTGGPGNPGTQTVTDGRLYWGVKFERNNNSALNVNANTEINPLIENFASFTGIEKMDVLVTGSSCDILNNNKFTLAKVALSNTSLTDVTASANVHMREAAYIRNSTVDPTTYKISSTVGNGRVTMASLLNSGSAILFNGFTNYAKFTTFMQGGWDGVNIFDKHASRFNDRSTSTAQGPSGYGLANSNYVSPGAPTGVNYTGAGSSNSNVYAYRTGIDIATNTSIANNNILATPGQRDPLITNYAIEKNYGYGLSFYLMDIETFDQTGVTSGRIFDGDTGKVPSIIQTSNAFVARAVDNNAAAAYFPNIIVNDTINNRKVNLPASIAAISALSYNDRVKFPWFAPAGFDRGSLSFVQLTSIRLNQTDRNTLFDANINPIVKFPGENYVFFSQNTLQQASTALESINVKRMLLEIKRQIVAIGNRLLFEQNTPALRQRFINESSLVLANVQLRQGIEKYAVICDARNNTDEDVNSNRMNAQIRVLPTRALEYIVMDFVILPNGVAL